METVCWVQDPSSKLKGQGHKYRSEVKKWDLNLFFSVVTHCYFCMQQGILKSLGTNVNGMETVCRAQDPGLYPKVQGHT